MGNIVYKTDYFTCTLSTAKKFNRQLQEAINKNVVEGWKLHSWQIPGALGEFCVLVFYREEETSYPKEP